MNAYAFAPLDEETIIITSLFYGDKLYAFIRSFYGFKDFSPRKCTISSKHSMIKVSQLFIFISHPSSYKNLQFGTY